MMIKKKPLLVEKGIDDYLIDVNRLHLFALLLLGNRSLLILFLLFFFFILLLLFLVVIILRISFGWL